MQAIWVKLLTICILCVIGRDLFKKQACEFSFIQIVMRSAGNTISNATQTLASLEKVASLFPRKPRFLREDLV
jgi:hypothetical protein